jgi:hypothetical protein
LKSVESGGKSWDVTFTFLESEERQSCKTAIFGGARQRALRE